MHQNRECGLLSFPANTRHLCTCALVVLHFHRHPPSPSAPAQAALQGAVTALAPPALASDVAREQKAVGQA